MHGCTYNVPGSGSILANQPVRHGFPVNKHIQGGYTANPMHLPDDNDAWQWKAKYPMQSKNMLVKGTITVRVKMGIIILGHVNIKIIGVSTYKAIH